MKENEEGNLPPKELKTVEKNTNKPIQLVPSLSSDDPGRTPSEQDEVLSEAEVSSSHCNFGLSKLPSLDSPFNEEVHPGLATLSGEEAVNNMLKDMGKLGKSIGETKVPKRLPDGVNKGPEATERIPPEDGPSDEMRTTSRDSVENDTHALPFDPFMAIYNELKMDFPSNAPVIRPQKIEQFGKKRIGEPIKAAVGDERALVLKVHRDKESAPAVTTPQSGMAKYLNPSSLVAAGAGVASAVTIIGMVCLFSKVKGFFQYGQAQNERRHVRDWKVADSF